MLIFKGINTEEKKCYRIHDCTNTVSVFHGLSVLSYIKLKSPPHSRLASSEQVDLYRIQKLLTHKSPQMTQRYAHLRDDALNGHRFRKKKCSAMKGSENHYIVIG